MENTTSLNKSLTAVYNLATPLFKNKSIKEQYDLMLSIYDLNEPEYTEDRLETIKAKLAHFYETLEASQEKNKRSIAIGVQVKEQNKNRIEKFQKALDIANKIPFLTVNATITEPSECAWADKDIEISKKQQAMTSRFMNCLVQMDELIDTSNCHSILKLGAFLEIKYMQIDKNYLFQRLQLAYKEAGVEYDYHDCDTDEDEVFAFFDTKISEAIKTKQGHQKLKSTESKQ